MNNLFPRLFKIRGLVFQRCISSKVPKMSCFKYPEARRDENVFDDYHGNKICDPYRWLEDPDSEETKNFVDAQNAITVPFLESYKSRADIETRLKTLWNYPKYTCPYKHGDKYFYYMNTGLQNHSVMYIQDTLNSEARVFLDPNTLSEDGTVAISGTAFTENGQTFAYGLSSSGSDWITIHFKDVATGNDYPEVLQKVKFSSLEWAHDHKGFFYGRYPDVSDKSDGSETSSNNNHKLYYHKLGTSQDEDLLVVEFLEEPQWRIGCEVSHCGKWLIITIHKDCQDNLVFYCDLEETGEIKGKLKIHQIIHKLEADYEYVTNEGSVCVFRTNKNAPNFKLVKIDLLDPSEDKWETLVPDHCCDVLDWAQAVDKNKLVICYIHDVKSILQLHSSETGKLLRNFPLNVGTISGFSGKKKHHEIFYLFTSFLTPGIIYRCDLKSQQEPEVFRNIDVKDFDPSLYESYQKFYESKDGTRVPIFIVHKKNIDKNGKNPCLMYGYGGFKISVQPYFSVSRLVFVQNFNGIFALPNIRGGGEYGEKWHNEGRHLKKQNVFDDFQWAGKYLIENKYTSPQYLTIQGSSNGGLLIAACVNQSPELFGAAIAQVGVMDMLRFHKFTIGYAWVSDYGNSEDDPKHFENLFKYSPLHNVKAPKDGFQYPSTLLLTADHDDRVVPLHSLKLAATLQHTLQNFPNQKNPLMIRIETKAGHGGGKPTNKLINEQTDILSFIALTLKLQFDK